LKGAWSVGGIKLAKDISTVSTVRWLKGWPPCLARTGARMVTPNLDHCSSGWVRFEADGTITFTQLRKGKSSLWRNPMRQFCKRQGGRKNKQRYQKV
jgi:hypothetical protein